LTQPSIVRRGSAERPTVSLVLKGPEHRGEANTCPTRLFPVLPSASPFHRPILAVLLALAWLALLPLPGARAAVPGVSPDLTWGISPSAQTQEARQLENAGVKWVRLNLNWDYVEPSPGVYDAQNLAMYDNAVRESQANGLKIVMLVSRSPQWASGSTNLDAPPRDPARYAHLVNFLAKRWGDAVAAYEVWNEENQQRFWPAPGGPDPAAYVALLKAAYPAIKAGNSHALVVFGGVTNDYAYVSRAYAAGAKRFFDVMSDHPYSCSLSPDRFSLSTSGRIQPSGFLAYRELHRTMVSNGDGAKPMWFTEFGWSTTSGPCGVSEQLQAAYLTRAYQLMARDPYVQVGIWYDWRNNYPYADADAYEARFGLFTSTWAPKPAYYAFVQYARGPLARASSIASLRLDAAIQKLRAGARRPSWRVLSPARWQAAAARVEFSHRQL
jgi:hypothetical protein